MMRRLLLHLGPPLRALHGVVRNRSIARMQLAFLLFNLAEPSMWVGIVIYAYAQGGTAAVGFVSILCLVPSGLLAPVAASLGDRFPRERVLRGGYFAQCLTTAAVAVALVADAPTWVVYALAVVACVPYTTGRPNHHSFLPGLATSPEEVAASNSVSALVEGIGYALGGLMAAALATVGPGAILGVSAAVLLAAALITIGIHPPAVDRPEGTFHPWTLATDAIIGLRALVRSRGPRALVMLAGTLALATGAVGVLMVPLAIERLGLGDPGVGFLTTMMSIGFFVGAGVSVAFASRHRLAFGMLAAAAIYGIGAAGFGLATVTTTAIVAAVIYGAGMTLLDVLGRTLLQRATADELLTRVFGAVEALWLLGIAVGAAIAPPVASAIGLEWGFVVMAGVVLVAAVIALPSLRAADDAAVVPERQLELLSGIPMFQPLPRLDLERIAGQLDRLSVTAGTDVIRQGDVGDRFYVVDAGTFAILVDGSQIDETTEGGYFGEIALLHDVPRTATVRATTEAAVWALDQEEFLATITGLPQSAHEAHAISQERLRTHEQP